jgi:hypothetical protein
MRRREVLAGGAALLTLPLAGCGHPPVVLDMDAASDERIAEEVSISPDPDSEEYAVVSSARANGTATRSGLHELFGRTDTVRLDGRVYRVSETRIASEDVRVYHVLVDGNPENTTAELGAVEYGDLPETDRKRLDEALSEGNPDTEGPDIGIDYGTAEEVGNDSAFVPERRYDIVVRNGTRYRVSVESDTTSEGTYRYEATEIAPSVTAFADRLRERYRFVLDGLSDAEREVVEGAIDGGYFDDDEAFRSVVERIREHEGLSVDDFYGTWLLTYGGEEYLTYAEW